MTEERKEDRIAKDEVSKWLQQQLDDMFNERMGDEAELWDLANERYGQDEEV